MPGDSTLAELHETLQVPWGGPTPTCIASASHGREFAIPRLGDAGLDDARQVRLSQFGFRLRERFLYEYDFTDGWQHEVRLEAIRPAAAGRAYPVCLAGNRPAPPKECGGPWAYLRLCDWLRRRALVSLVVLAEDLLARPAGRVSQGRHWHLLAIADEEDDDEDLTEGADDPWEIRTELEHLLPRDALPWTPWASHAMRPPHLPGGYDPVQVAAAVLDRRRLPFDPERFDRRRLNARLARLGRGDRDGLFEPDWV